MQPQMDEARMLERALQFYPLLAQRLNEADKAIVLEEIPMVRGIFKGSTSWAIGIVCCTLSSYSGRFEGCAANLYVDKHIRPRLSNVSGVGEPWAPSLPRGVE